MDSNAAGLVLRRALKTRFSEMGWGSTPLLSAKTIRVYDNGSRRVLDSCSASSILATLTNFRMSSAINKNTKLLI
jgi:hypothetical protein